jgi:hypothetical protein
MSSLLTGIPPRKRLLENVRGPDPDRALPRRKYAWEVQQEGMGARLKELGKENDISKANDLFSNREATLQAMARNAIVILKGSHPAVVSGEIPKPITPRRFLKQIGVESADVKHTKSSKNVKHEWPCNLREPVLASRESDVQKQRLDEKGRLSSTDSDLPELSQVEEGEDDILLSTHSQDHCGTPGKVLTSKSRKPYEADCVTPSTAEAARNLLALTG